MRGFCIPNPVQYSYCVIQSDPNPAVLSKYLTRSGLYQKKTLIKHFIAVINAVWISISDPVEFFKNPVRPDAVLNWRIWLERDPESRSCQTLLHNRDERTDKFFSTSPILIQINYIRSSPDLQNFWYFLSDPVLIRQCKIIYFYFASWARRPTGAILLLAKCD